MIVSDILIALIMVCLAGLFWMDLIEVWHIYAMNFLTSVGRAFQSLALITSTALMVPEKHLARIQGTNQTLHGVLSMAAPPLGALALALIQMHFILALDVVTAVLAIGPLLVILIPEPERTMDKQPDKGFRIWDDTVAGVRYLWRWPGLRNLLLIAAALNFFGNTMLTISPLLIADHFNGGAIELGWFNSAWGTGIVLGGVIVGTWGGFRRRIMTTILGWFVYGIGTAFVGIAPNNLLTFAVIGIAISGVGSSLINAPLRALLQAHVAPHFQGRVFGAIESSTQSTTMLGLIVIGPVTDALGPQPWFLAGGVLTLLLGASARMIPSVAGIEDKGQQGQIGSAK